MIVGIGVDIVDIDRIERLVQRYGEQFERKVFTPNEMVYCRGMARPATHYAGRFSVKEAFYKALPRSCQPLGRWCGVETVRGGDGAPKIDILDTQLRDALDREGVSRVHVTISHERHACVAMVVLESTGSGA